jgi:hypothetical protein
VLEHSVLAILFLGKLFKSCKCIYHCVGNTNNGVNNPAVVKKFFVAILLLITITESISPVERRRDFSSAAPNVYETNYRDVRALYKDFTPSIHHGNLYQQDKAYLHRPNGEQPI